MSQPYRPQRPVAGIPLLFYGLLSTDVPLEGIICEWYFHSAALGADADWACSVNVIQ
jgi:hypothetical protein